MDDGIRVNEGGLFDANGMFDSLIEDTNEMVRSAMTGNYIAFCRHAVEIVQKLAVLKKGVTEQEEQLREQVDDLRKMNDRLAGQIYEKKDVE